MTVIIEELQSTDNYYQYCCLLKQLTSIDPNSITKENFDNHLKLIKSNHLHKIIIAKMDDKIIGTITIIIEPKFIHNLSLVAHIEDIVVDFNHRTHGIGSLLLQKAIQIGRDLNCYKIILDCPSEKIDFYKKFGFVQKETQMALYLDNL